MKKFFLVAVSFFLLPACFAQTPDLSKPDTTNYVFTVRTPSIKALESYPQQIIGISKVGDNYRIELSVSNPYSNEERLGKMLNAAYEPDREYPHEVARYLQSTPLIDSENEQIRQIADTLFTGEENMAELIKKALSFTHSYLSFDESLALQIDAGTCRTLDVETILSVRKGTCSEYSNLFIALMRYKGIPTRFCVGYIYGPEYKSVGTHAWPECYIDGVGWCAVDPTANSLWYFHFMAIKMRHGLDYEDCDIRTLALDIEPVEIEKLKK